MLQIVFAGDTLALKREQKLSLAQAWHTVKMMPRPKKHRMPNLETMLRRIDDQEMTPQELRATAMGWHNQAGGTTRVVPKGSIKRPWD